MQLALSCSCLWIVDLMVMMWGTLLLMEVSRSLLLLLLIVVVTVDFVDPIRSCFHVGTVFPVAYFDRYVEDQNKCVSKSGELEPRFILV